MRYSLILILLLAACATDPSTPPLALAVNRIDVLGGNAQTDTVNQQLPDPILVRVLDTTSVVGASLAPAAPIAGQVINFVVTSGGGHVFAGAAVTDSLGRAQERWTLGTAAGPQTLEARAVDPESGEPIVYAVITATAVPGPVASVHFTATSVRTEIGVPFTVPFVATDAFGNAVPAPAPTSPDTIALLPLGNLWQATTGQLGSPRLIHGTDTLWVYSHPRSGPYLLKLLHGDTVWRTTGTLTRTGVVKAVAPWCPTADLARDSAAVYRATNEIVTRQIADGAVDTLQVSASRDAALCHHTYGRAEYDQGEFRATIRPLFAYFPLGAWGEVGGESLPYATDSTRAFFALNLGGLRDTLFVTP